jgi:hypothetical protein
VHALIITEPVATALAVPLFVASLLIVATAVLEEFQVTEASVFVLLSLKVPVATKDWFAPTNILGSRGLTAIETSPGGVRVLG